MVATRKKKNHQTKQFRQLNETLNTFVIGNSNNKSAKGNGSLEPQDNDYYHNAERIVFGEIGACQNQVVKNNIDNRIGKAFDNAVKTVENRIQDAILTAMDNVVIPRVENTKNTPIMSASSRLDLKIDQDKIDESRNIENFGDGDFPELSSNYDWRAHTHHTAVKWKISWKVHTIQAPYLHTSSYLAHSAR